jgi:hypothetical protein
LPAGPSASTTYTGVAVGTDTLTITPVGAAGGFAAFVTVAAQPVSGDGYSFCINSP